MSASTGPGDVRVRLAGDRYRYVHLRTGAAGEGVGSFDTYVAKESPAIVHEPEVS